MGNSTASQIEPITIALLGIFAAAALVAIAVAVARHFVRKGEDASAPSGLGSRISHVVGYIFAGGLIAAGGVSVSNLAKGSGGEDAIRNAASQTGSDGKNPFAPTESSGLEPIAGKRSKEGEAVSRLVDHMKAEADRQRKTQMKQEALSKIKGAASNTQGMDVVPIEDDETARAMLSAGDYLRYTSGVRFVAVTSARGERFIRAVD